MNPILSELAVWAAPVMLAIIGFFFQREFNKQDEKTTEIFHYIRNELPKEFVSRHECLSCKAIADERRISCKEVVGRLEHNIDGLVDQIDKLDDCVKVVGSLKC